MILISQNVKLVYFGTKDLKMCAQIFMSLKIKKIFKIFINVKIKKVYCESEQSIRYVKHKSFVFFNISLYV